MKKLILSCLLTGMFLFVQAIDKLIIKPYVEGKGMRGWVIDSIRIGDTATLVYGQFGLGKGWTARGEMNDYIEIPATGKRYQQTGLKGLPQAPGFVIGEGQQVHFEYIFPPIDPATKTINITSKDFDGKGAAWYGVWLTPRKSIFTEQLGKLSGLEGNWYSTDGSGKWKCGFYTDKVFWNEEFRDYKVLKVVGNSASLELIKPNAKNVLLEVTLQPDSSLTLITNGSKLNLNKKPYYTGSDHSAFNNAFSKNDSLTVSGYYQVANPVFSKQAALIVPDLISDNPRIYPIQVAVDGKFQVKIPFYHAARVTFSNQLGPQSPLSEVSFMAEPGNHIILTYHNENENAVVFGGDNERVNNEFQSFTVVNPYFVTERKLNDRIQTGWDSFVKWRKDQFEKVGQSYASAQTTTHFCSKFNAYMKLYMEYALISDLTKGAIKSGLKMDQVDFLPSMSDSAFYNHQEALLLPEYTTMCTGLRALQQITSRITLSEICANILENGLPTPNEIALLKKMQNRQDNIETKEKYENYKTFLTENKASIDSLFKKYQSVTLELQNNKSQQAKLKYKLPVGIGNDLSSIVAFGNKIAREEYLLSPEEIRLLNLKIKNQYLSDLLLQRNKEVEAKLEKIQHAELPKGIHTYVLPEDTKDLLSAITQKYKGKVIYVDFWATWCGPCRGELPYSEKRKEDFKGKDVVFVYITGASSPEMTWKKMIVDIPGEHFKLSDQQWNTICEQYKISGIPHYMLIDKSGKMVLENAPRPSTEIELNDAINQLL